MAVVFELVLNVGSDAARSEAEQILANRVVAVRGVQLPLAGPYGSGTAELSFVVPAIGLGGPKVAVPFDVRTLTAPEVSEVGLQLYDLLREVTAYEVAAVGWDPESRVDPHELEVDLAHGWPIPAGVVLAHHVADRLGVADALEPFDANHLWVPYAGDRTVWRPGA